MLDRLLKAARQLARRCIPDGVILAWRRRKVEANRRVNSKRSLKDIFSTIYQEAQWGGVRGEFCSGSGSTVRHVEEYGAHVRDLISTLNIRSVVDLGCGDFAVAKAFQRPNVKYTGIDIVESLIERNRKEYGGSGANFLVLDITAEPVPNAELCLIRQVLQHLSNEQILRVLENTRHFQYVLITEHYPAPLLLTTPNLDKPAGPDTRVVDGSGVFLDRPPFGVKNIRLTLDVSPERPIISCEERIRTYLIARDGEPPPL